MAAAAAAAAAEAMTTTTTTTTMGFYDQAHYYTVGVFDKYGDPRVSNYQLMRTPWPTVLATLVYYWFVRHAGPRMMRNRKPYEILPLVRVYNVMMALWNGFGFYAACQLTNYGQDLIGCRPIDPYKRDEMTLNQIYYGWIFYTSRIVEFADTVFFVLRKKDNQVSSFHVFHHSSVPTVSWFFFKFAPGGNSGIFPFINAAIHTIMYTYYFLATFPAAKPYLGWKKYLTQLQISQFFIIIACCMQPLFIPGCKFPRALLLIMVAFSFVFIYLFVDFYLKSYKTKAAKLQESKDKKQAGETVLKSKQHEQIRACKNKENNSNSNNNNINNNIIATDSNYADRLLTSKSTSSKKHQ